MVGALTSHLARVQIPASPPYVGCFPFTSGDSGFPLSPKTNISKFQFEQESGRQEPLRGCATSKSLFIPLNSATLFTANLFAAFLSCRS